jgi:hypothetical protein
MQGASALVVLLAGARCAGEIREQLSEWRARVEEMQSDASGPTGTRFARIPTGDLGTWVRLQVEPRGEALLERITEARAEEVRFGPSCQRLPAEKELRALDPDAWTDAALVEWLRRGDRGIILLWSPHMPLSVDAVLDLAALTEELGLGLVPLLDPAADAAYAKAVGRERGLPPSALRPLGGVELAFRGMTTHAPSLQAFADGRLVGPVLPGYRGRNGFRHAIENLLRQR